MSIHVEEGALNDLKNAIATAGESYKSNLAKLTNLMSEIIIFINERELIISGFGDKIVFRSLDESF